MVYSFLDLALKRFRWVECGRPEVVRVNELYYFSFILVYG